MPSGKNQKANRDRFVGFSFAAAHLLLETTNAGVVTFAAGARCGLVSGSLDELLGRSIFEYFPNSEHALLQMLFQRLIHKGKIDLTQIFLHSASGTPFSAYLGACRLPNLPDRCFLSVTIRGQSTEKTPGHRVPDLANFLPVLENRLATADATEISQALSMVLIEGLPNVSANPKVREAMEAYLLSISSDGDSAVRLTEDRYAVLHSDEGALEDIQRDINKLLTDNRADDLVGNAKLWRVTVGKTELPTSDVAKAIAYTLKKFANENPRAIKITNIDNAVEDLLNSTVLRVSQVRKTLEQKNFHLVFQPILRLSSSQLHHVEAFMRVDGADSPASFVAFAEGIGLISDLDLLVVQEALRQLHRAAKAGQNVPDIAVNLSAASLASKLFMDQLEQIILPTSELCRKLLIDITEMAAISDFGPLKASLARLQRLGIRRCLGDVGSGSASFMALNELKVDFAKIDGKAIVNAMKDNKERTILQSLIQICSHLGTLVIAGQIESEEQRRFLRGLGINLGQGFLLGHPSPALPVLEPPVKISVARRSAAQPTEEGSV